ncbi:monovalent cation:H+ antiporter-1, CPA1 family [Galdieria sulphuraria]|uniref:Sodium/hydrogen exchanger n=1 Tax=Galdieria sulphuraria TaxID=130081 RepID=M2XUK4_GALSU|nr:monovalent cation:H+ antiporter-1, CPA1 family [Galdieria sulphuraria]EME27323.1 monovalent cation:H+ antiporter-1, CPA1 family [Galdieria sulphuraria]|eukprot:XP_005703843.1 monovalent cation:H+ antiporter-1, CPA1 family [Galdieria sulphuraria]
MENEHSLPDSTQEPIQQTWSEQYTALRSRFPSLSLDELRQLLYERGRRTSRSTLAIVFLSLVCFSLVVALWSVEGIGRVKCPECNCGSDAQSPETTTQIADEAEKAVGFGLTVSGLTLLLCIFSTYFILQNHFTALPDCIAYVFLGILVGAMIRIFARDIVGFVNQALPSQVQFFLFVLPPIIFEAGYSLNKTDFFAQSGSIFVFAVIGTFVSAVAFGILLWLMGIIHASFTLTFWEALSFGALISAVDPVATIAVFNALRVNKTLHFLVFGESVLNDAVAIVLYHVFSSMLVSDRPSSITPFFQFIEIFFGSAAIGFVNAAVTALMLKYTNLFRYPTLESSLYFMLAFFPYLLCEGVGLSGIMGVLSNGVFLAHYAHPNLSPIAQISSQQAFKMIAFLAETFVFVYLGLALTTFRLSWQPLLVLWGIIFTLVSRAFNIFPLSWILNRYRADKISMKNQFIMWFSGLRGAIAFALSLNFPTQGANSEVRRAVISTTLSIVLFTVIVLGGGTMPLLRLLRVEGADSAETDVVHSRFIENNEEEDTTEDSNGRAALHGIVTSREYKSNFQLGGGGGIIRPFGIFQYFDNCYLKPCFRVAHTRTGEATERALRRIASTRGRYLTPHEIGSYLEAAAEEVSPLYSPRVVEEDSLELS